MEVVILNSFAARDIFMKCQFSPCGCYLHIASLEGSFIPMETSFRRKKHEFLALQLFEPTVKLTVFLTTYRLSTSKTTRSPPFMVHRVRVPICSEHILHVSKLPTFNFTKDELYVAYALDAHSPHLGLHRINLFHRDGFIDYLVPENVVVLPQSAKRRTIHYLPPQDGGDLSQIILGTETRSSPMFADQWSALPVYTNSLMNYDVYGSKGALGSPLVCYQDEKVHLVWGDRKPGRTRAQVIDQLSGRVTRVRMAHEERKLEHMSIDFNTSGQENHDGKLGTVLWIVIRELTFFFALAVEPYLVPRRSSGGPFIMAHDKTEARFVTIDGIGVCLKCLRNGIFFAPNSHSQRGHDYH